MDMMRNESHNSVQYMNSRLSKIEDTDVVKKWTSEKFKEHDKRLTGLLTKSEREIGI